MNVVESIIEKLSNDKSFKSFYGEPYERGITNAELLRCSAKVYAYLSDNNIGKNDVVLIKLTGRVNQVIAIFGVMRTGAIFTVVDDISNNSDTEKVFDICKAKIIIDDNIWEIIMNYREQENCEDIKDNDPAYIVFTSGTTGIPKGILHEYGKIKLIVDSKQFKNNKQIIIDDIRGVVPSPCNAVSTYMLIFFTLYDDRKKIYFPSHSVINNSFLAIKYVITNRINSVLLPASYVKSFKKIIDFLNLNVYIGGEESTNVSLNRSRLFNLYALSEASFIIASYKIEHNESPCHIGKNYCNQKISIISEKGEEVKKGEVGEIVVENKFTRGYINVDEKENKSFKNGLLYTGDLGYEDENGEYVYLGRKDKSFNNHGYRIEPTYIENVIKETFNIKKVIVKPFFNNNKTNICAYYDGEINIGHSEILKELSIRLPFYMLPTYVIKLDKSEYDINSADIYDKLKLPNIEDYKSPYVMPKSIKEKKFCDIVKNILKLDKVGLDDDFFIIGGDHMAAYEVISKGKYKNITIQDFYDKRIVKEIISII